MKIHEFLSTHPLISISSIERACNISHGTLRKGKDIPERFINQIASILKDYGYNAETSLEKPEPMISVKPMETIKKVIESVKKNNKVSEQKSLKEIRLQNYLRNNNLLK